jgi:hypothetical protein
MISRRTILSLAQFLALQDFSAIAVLLEKHNIHLRHVRDSLSSLAASFPHATEENIRALLDEVFRTQGSLRNDVTPRYRYDERFRDLERCLLLDGYVIKDCDLVPLDPTVLENPSVEDDLTEVLKQSGLPEAGAVIQKLIDSAEAFRKTEPNYNASLNDARIALQTLATSIAKVRVSKHPGNFDEKKWGSVLVYLKVSKFVTEEQEKGLAGVFGFVSPGSHVPLGLTEMEMTRLGRSFIISMCWFLAKHYLEKTT